jgi:hypothetical protein
MARSNVHNPILNLPAMIKLRGLPAGQRKHLAGLLIDLGSDARHRADICWFKHKAPMAAYWKAVSVYARHTAKALRRK